MSKVRKATSGNTSTRALDPEKYWKFRALCLDVDVATADEARVVGLAKYRLSTALVARNAFIASLGIDVDGVDEMSWNDETREIRMSRKSGAGTAMKQ